MSNDFQIWLNQKVWVSGTEKAKRRTYIPAFAAYITDFMKKRGYTMDRRWRKGEMVIARWLYTIHVTYHFPHKKITYPAIVHRDWIEDYDEFYHVIDFNEVSECLTPWKLNEDLDTSTGVGSATVNELQQLLWTYIDLQSSKQGIRIADYLDESDSDSESGGYRHVDRYIQDASEGYHGGGWAKV